MAFLSLLPAVGAAIGQDTKMPDYVVLLSTVGGMALFGLNGFVIGPAQVARFHDAGPIRKGVLQPAQLGGLVRRRSLS